jgi:hypothetical protein
MNNSNLRLVRRLHSDTNRSGDGHDLAHVVAKEKPISLSIGTDGILLDGHGHGGSFEKPFPKCNLKVATD